MVCTRKYDLLNHYVGRKCQKITQHLPYDVDKDFGPGGGAAAQPDHYRALKEALTLHFAPKKNSLHASFVFHAMKQEESETSDAFAARLRRQASFCDFCDEACANKSIRDQIVAGCKSARLRRNALDESLSLNRLLEVAH